MVVHSQYLIFVLVIVLKIIFTPLLKLTFFGMARGHIVSQPLYKLFIAREYQWLHLNRKGRLSLYTRQHPCSWLELQQMIQLHTDTSLCHVPLIKGLDQVTMLLMGCNALKEEASLGLDHLMQWNVMLRIPGVVRNSSFITGWLFFCKSCVVQPWWKSTDWAELGTRKSSG